MKIVVAGGTGFLGRHIVAGLRDAGHGVTVLTRHPESAARIPQLAGVQTVRGDATQPSSLSGMLEGAEAVVGALAFPNYPMEQPRRGLTFDRYERQATENLLAEAKRAGVSRYLYISGAGADPYSEKSWYRAKGVAEAALKTGGLDYVILRPSWAYGPEDKALNKFAAIARFSPLVPRFVRTEWGKRVGPFTFGFLRFREQVVQPVHVDDIALAVVRAFERDDAWNRTFEIGGERLEMRKVIATMLRVMNKRRLQVPVPDVLAKLGTAPLVVLPKPPLTPGGVEFAVQDGLVDTTELEKVLEVSPVALEEGLRRYLR